MKTRLSLTLLLLIAGLLNSFAQITILSEDLMQPGDTFLIHYDQTPEISIDGTYLEDHNWDYTHLSDDSVNFSCYAPSNELDFFNEFPDSDFYTYGPGFLYAGPGGGSPSGSNFGYMMFDVNEYGMYVEGFYSDYGYGYTSTYNNPAELLISIPNYYTHVDNNDSHWSVELNAVASDQDTIYKGFVVKTLTTDAWGSLECPYGTYDVIRIHEQGYTVDSIYVEYMGVSVFTQEVQRDTINRYMYWAKEIRHPLVTLHLNESGEVEKADYLFAADYAGIGQKTSEKGLKLFPNPVSDQLYVQNTNGKVFVYDMCGKLLFSETIKNRQSIDVSNLPEGIYIIKDNQGNSKKFMKQ